MKLDGQKVCSYVHSEHLASIELHLTLVYLLACQTLDLHDTHHALFVLSDIAYIQLSHFS